MREGVAEGGESRVDVGKCDMCVVEVVRSVYIRGDESVHVIA